jgi:multiple sugar transport system substrate-binding protein
MGGEILSSDLKTAAFNSNNGMEALQMIIDLQKKGVVSTEYKEEAFFNGQVGMIDNGTWQMDTAFGKDKKANFGVALLPKLKDNVKPYSGLGLSGYAVTSASKNAKAAYDFIEFYCTNSKYQLDFCKKNNLIPSIKNAYKDSFYSTPEWKTMIKQLEYSKFRPSVPGWEKIEEIVANAVLVSLNGTMKPKDALNAAAKSVNGMLK